MREDEVTAVWAATVAQETLGEVLVTTRCAALTATDSARKGELYIGQWAALFVPETLLHTEFDPESDELIHLRYADFAGVTFASRWIVPTVAVRFSDQLSLVGSKKAMMTMHQLWAEDQQFERSTDETWA